jgi:hypothetical protein
VLDIRARTDRPIIYRPKPSFKDAQPIEGTEFSTGDETINDALWGAHALVTHGSNACFEAALLGVPSIVLGDAVAAPISSRSLDDDREPLRGKREQWFANLAYHQFTERSSRTAWDRVGSRSAAGSRGPSAEHVAGGRRRRAAPSGSKTYSGSLMRPHVPFLGA